MELDITSTAHLREQFRQTQPNSAQRQAVLRAALTGSDSEALAQELVHEYHSGTNQGEPGAAADAQTNLEILGDALEQLWGELPDTVRGVCDQFVREQHAQPIDPSARQPQSRWRHTDTDDRLSELVGLAVEVEDTLKMLEQCCAAAARAIGASEESTDVDGLLANVQSARLTAVACRNSIVRALDRLIRPQQLVDTFSDLAVSIGWAGEQVLDGLSQPLPSTEILEDVVPIVTTAIGILNQIAAHQGQGPAGTTLENAAALRDGLIARLASFHDRNLSSLPADVLFNVLTFLSPADVETLGATTRHFRTMVQGYQTTAEGRKRHQHFVDSRETEHRKAEKKLFDEWLEEYPQHGAIYLEEYSDRLCGLLEQLVALDKLVDGRADHDSTWNELAEATSGFMSPHLDMLCAEKEIVASCVRMSPSLAIPVGFSTLSRAASSLWTSLYDGTSDEITRVIKIVLPQLLAEIDAAVDLLPRSQWHSARKLRRQMNSVRSAADQVIAAIRSIRSKRDQQLHQEIDVQEC